MRSDEIKFSNEVKTRVTDDVRVAMDRAARSERMTLSEWQRRNHIEKLQARGFLSAEAAA